MNLLTLGQSGILRQAPDPELPDCEKCDGSGGFDASKDPEVYDEWITCPFCEGTGKHKFDEIFIHERDALTPRD